jgi:general secretion pathway protein G
VRPKEYILLAATIAMLSMLIIPKIVRYERARNLHEQINRPPRTDIQNGVLSLIGAFQVDNGFYPKRLEDLVQEPADAKNWHGPYLEKIPVDPWGHKYFYECPGKHNPKGYDLSSAGADGTAGTGDDIVNWAK